MGTKDAFRPSRRELLVGALTLALDAILAEVVSAREMFEGKPDTRGVYVFLDKYFRNLPEEHQNVYNKIFEEHNIQAELSAVIELVVREFIKHDRERNRDAKYGGSALRALADPRARENFVDQVMVNLPRAFQGGEREMDMALLLYQNQKYIRAFLRSISEAAEKEMR